jgi:hypothetical protein
VKAGTENRNKVIAASVLGALAVLLLAFELSSWFSGPSTTASAGVPPSTPTITLSSSPKPSSNGTNRKGSGKKDVAQTIDPTLRVDVLKSSEDTKYEGTGRNIFRVFVEPPPPPVVPVTTASQPAQPAVYVPPPPPPINLKFYGFATPAGGAKRIFLAQGEDVFIAKEGDIVDRRYKVVRIAPNSVEILDVLSNNRQSIPLSQG